MKCAQDQLSRTHRGSALVAVFWLIAVMGLLVFGALQFVAVDSRTVTAQRGLAQARRQAEQGLALGAHPQVERGDPLLRFVSGTEGYLATISSEEARLNPNTLVVNRSQTVMNRLFLSWGMQAGPAAALTGAITDWIDPDQTEGLNGAEARTYAAAGRPGLPMNRAFTSFDEMRMVIGMDALEALRPDWRDSFTLWTFGRVNLNEASPEVIAAVTGVRLTAAQRMVTTLAGQDGIRYTKDDLRFASVEEALQRLGMTGQPSPLLGIEGTTRHVECIGKAGDFQCKLVMVLSGAFPLYRSEVPFTPGLISAPPAKK